MSSPAERMTPVEDLRGFISQRLTAAAAEIFSVFEQTVVRYEEEINRQRKLLEISWNPRIKLHRIENADQPFWGENELWNQDRISSPDPEEPVPIKEEGDVEPGQSETMRFTEEPLPIKEEPEPQEDAASAFSYDTWQFMRRVSDDQRDPGGEALPYEPAPRREDHNDHESFNLGSFTTEEPARSRPSASPDINRQIHIDENPSKFVLFGNKYKFIHRLKEDHKIHSGEKPFLCKFCGKTFRLQRSLCLHMRTHTGEKPHSCEICGKRFRQPSHLLVHKRIHTGEKPYSCKICGQTFRQYGNLFTHTKRHKNAKSES